MLPKNSTPIYNIKLPVSKKHLKYRPWIAIENKKFLISALSKNNEEIQDALVTILNACIFDECDVLDLPMVDFELLFTQVKAKSKDEIISLNYNATEEVDGVNSIIPIELNLMEVDITPIPDTKIMLMDHLGVVMKIPTLRESREIDSKTDDFEKIALMVDSVFDETQIYDSSVFTYNELVNWLKHLTEKQLEKLLEFIKNIPTITVSIDVLINDGKGMVKNKNIILKGLSDFFL